MFCRRPDTLALAAGVLLLTAPLARAQSNEFRGIWVDAWGNGFLNASQVTQLISDCRAYNFNAIVVQMRRRGDAFYTPLPGNDPKTTAISSNFDALADIIAKARSGSPRIEVHCWVTTFVIWSSTSPPSQAGHVFNLHPEYLTRSSTGTNFISEGYYLDPGHPDATLWNYVMATNIVRRYDVDGFHWDYIRYPTTDSGYNPTALARYNAEFGLSGQPSPSDSQFSNWRRRQVTDFLRWVNADLLSIRSNLVISCAVFGSRSDAYNARFQDWAGWNNEGIIDICMPMGYTSDNALFRSRVDDAFNNQGVRRVYSGQGAYLNTKENTVYQLGYIRGKPLLGSVFYSYRTPNSGTVNQTATFTYLRDNHQPTWASVPSIPWKASPTKGLVKGTVTRSDNGAAVYNATVTLNTSPVRTQKTEPHGKYAFFEANPGTYNISATASELGTATGSVTVAAGGIVVANLALPPDSTPPLISSVVVINLADTSATVTWTTDENSNSTVEYGPTTSYGSTVSNATMTISHSVNLTNLSASTTYHFRGRSRNAANLQAISGDFTFQTNPSGVVSDIIIDDDDATTTGSWTRSTTSPGYYGPAYRYNGIGTGSERVEFRPNILTAGNYAVYVWYVQGGNRTQDAPHIVKYNGGTQTIFINQQVNGSQWVLLGTFNFAAGTNGYVRVTDGFTTGNVVMADAVKFVFAPVPASITTQPQSRTVNQGEDATFSVVAAGSAPLRYQWRFNGGNITGATASSYTRVNAQPAHAGNYSVVITNAAGSVTSAVATLTVNIPPTITAPPRSQTVRVESNVTFTVAATGTSPLSYQWKFDDVEIPGATGTSYIRSNVQVDDAGYYSVVVSNAAGVASGEALLTVSVPQPAQFESISLLPDRRVHLVVIGDPDVEYLIEASSNWVDWVTVTNFSGPDGRFEFSDSSVTNNLQRFYRAKPP